MNRFFDYIKTICPQCNAQLDAEVKADCMFEEFDLNRPVNISDAQKLVGNVVRCEECGKRFEIVGDIPTHKVYLDLKEIK